MSTCLASAISLAATAAAFFFNMTITVTIAAVAPPTPPITTSGTIIPAAIAPPLPPPPGVTGTSVLEVICSGVNVVTESETATDVVDSVKNALAVTFPSVEKDGIKNSYEVEPVGMV